MKNYEYNKVLSLYYVPLYNSYEQPSLADSQLLQNIYALKIMLDIYNITILKITHDKTNIQSWLTKLIKTIIVLNNKFCCKFLIIYLKNMFLYLKNIVYRVIDLLNQVDTWK